jgi:hypothetical protein
MPLVAYPTVLSTMVTDVAGEWIGESQSGT